MKTFGKNDAARKMALSRVVSFFIVPEPRDNVWNAVSELETRWGLIREFGMNLRNHGTIERFRGILEKVLDKRGRSPECPLCRETALVLFILRTQGDTTLKALENYYFDRAEAEYQYLEHD